MNRVLTLIVSLSAAGSSPLTAAGSEGIEFFEQKIRPVLVNRCYQCHSAGAKEVGGRLLLDTREGIRRGGESGHAIVPGNLDESVLVGAIRHETFEMPPDEKLSEGVIRNFEKWVRMGAPDPRDGKAAPIQTAIDFEQARQHWAYQPIRPPDVPEVAASDWPDSDVDRFVLAKLEARGLQPVGDADAHSLVRRVYFDLVGLPPTPEQIEQFVADPSREALALLVGELLESPHFGERWGRHWLDVVRFAESTGMERNFTFPHAWRYRDYVIDAFNSDKPFDQFLREQVAGDLLVAETADQVQEQLAATGLLAVGTKLLNERDDEAFEMEMVDDQIDVVSRAFLGLTASCARCHDHKFDPIPQTEYYALAGIFCSTKTHYGTTGQNGNRQPGELIAVRNNEVRSVPVGDDKKNAGNLKSLKMQLKSQEKRLATLRKRDRSPSIEKQIANAEKRIRSLKNKVGKLQIADQPGDTANAVLLMGVRDDKQIEDAQLRIRGEPDEKAGRVPRAFLTIATLGEAPPVSENASGRRELAEWLVAESNPLTARVAANRIWQHLFGRGIVPTVNNFGLNGERPSHPELLDYLALRLRENGWSWKETIRDIMLSRVYRLSTREDNRGLQIDPGNDLLWRMNQRRLEVEAIRDAMLAASGQLDTSPMQGSVVAAIGDGNVGRGIDPETFVAASFKRSVYLPIVRGAVPEMLRIFDFPEPSIIGGQRDVTTVPTQALYMMNSDFVARQSEALARRLLSDSARDDRERVELAYLRTLARHPSASETGIVLDFIEQADSADREGGPAGDLRLRGWAGFCQALLASAEFRYLD